MMKRNSIAALSLSAAALIGIAGWESYRGEAYYATEDEKARGISTIGFGTTKDVKPGDKTTPVRALQQLGKDADVYQQAMRRCITVPLHQWEFDAGLSLAYNIGPTAFCRSTAVKKLNVGDYAGFCNEFLRWNKAGGKVLNGLTKRRQQERDLCMGLSNA
jgi:lysozyme